MRLTDSKVKSLRPKKSRYIVWEEGGTGLGLRVSPADRKSFIFMYRFDDHSPMMAGNEACCDIWRGETR